MNAVFRPSALKGRVTAPPSKSVTHRALICGAFTSGANISGIELSRDVNATLGGLKSLGTEVRYENGKAFVGGLKIPAHFKVFDPGRASFAVRNGFYRKQKAYGTSAGSLFFTLPREGPGF